MTSERMLGWVDGLSQGLIAARRGVLPVPCRSGSRRNGRPTWRSDVEDFRAYVLRSVVAGQRGSSRMTMG